MKKGQRVETGYGEMGVNCRLRRLRLGLSQRELAMKAGWAFSAVGHFETGRLRPNLDRLHRLCVALQSTIPEMLPMRWKQSHNLTLRTRSA